jgi:hypothetical protein
MDQDTGQWKASAVVSSLAGREDFFNASDMDEHRIATRWAGSCATPRITARRFQIGWRRFSARRLLLACHVRMARCFVKLMRLFNFLFVLTISLGCLRTSIVSFSAAPLFVGLTLRNKVAHILNANRKVFSVAEAIFQRMAEFTQRARLPALGAQCASYSRLGCVSAPAGQPDQHHHHDWRTS